MCFRRHFCLTVILGENIFVHFCIFPELTTFGTKPGSSQWKSSTKSGSTVIQGLLSIIIFRGRQEILSTTKGYQQRYHRFLAWGIFNQTGFNLWQCTFSLLKRSDNKLFLVVYTKNYCLHAWESSDECNKFLFSCSIRLI